MHLLLLAIEGLAYLCTGRLQLTPDATYREVLMLERGALFFTVGASLHSYAGENMLGHE